MFLIKIFLLLIFFFKESNSKLPVIGLKFLFLAFKLLLIYSKSNFGYFWSLKSDPIFFAVCYLNWSSPSVQFETLISTFLVDLLGFKTIFGRARCVYSNFLNKILGELLYLLKNILFVLIYVLFDLDWFDIYSDSNIFNCSLGWHLVFWFMSENLFESFNFRWKVCT